MGIGCTSPCFMGLCCSMGMFGMILPKRRGWCRVGARSSVPLLSCRRAEAVACREKSGFQAPIPFPIISQLYFPLPPSLSLDLAVSAALAMPRQPEVCSGLAKRGVQGSRVCAQRCLRGLGMCLVLRREGRADFPFFGHPNVCWGQHF